MEKILRRNFSPSLARGTAPNKARKRNERRFTKNGEETESKANK